MMKRVMLGFATFALVVASAASSHNLTLFQQTNINGKELKPGDYKIELNDNKVVIKSGKNAVAEADVKVVPADNKFSSTTVRYTSDAGKNRVQEIRIGGTNTKLVFGDNGQVAP